MAQKRYELVITFKSSLLIEKNTGMIEEKFSTKREALKYADIIDDTVYKAFIEDRATGKIEWLKH